MLGCTAAISVACMCVCGMFVCVLCMGLCVFVVCLCVCGMFVSVSVCFTTHF